MTDSKKMPRPIRISRKFKLSSERLVVLAADAASEIAAACTKKRTGCPIHTC